MNNILKFLISTYIISIVLKLLLIPFAHKFFISISLILCLIYLFGGFAIFNRVKLSEIFKKDSYKNISILKLISGVFIGVCMFIQLQTIIFGLSIWPGSIGMVRSGLIFTIIPFTIILIAFIKNKDKSYIKTIFNHFLITSIIIITLNIIPQKECVKILFRDSPTLIESYNEYSKDPDNQRKIDAFNKERVNYFANH